MSATYLAIDAGKTGTRAVVVDAGLRSATVTGRGLDNVAAIGGLEAVRSVLQEALARLPSLATAYDGVCIGLTGVLSPGHHAARVLGLLGALAPARRVVVTSDAVTSYCGALGLRAGVVVAAGTGTVTLGVGPDGRLARVGGWGYLLDDGGSAFAIGRAGVRAALRTSDGRSAAEELLLAARSRFGGTDAIVDAVYGAANPPSLVASFAPDVVALARAGDRSAAGIVEDAAAQLADGVAAAARRAFGTHRPVPVSWCGGVFRAGSVILEPFHRALDLAVDGAQPRPPAGDALDGAALLAASAGPTPLDALLRVAEGSPA
ncbi:MAG: N-acetylglucosamine kinase [Nitriliruptoraceae bacterium]